ncbi:MAG TPA: hypothetical protein QGI69_02495 [Candidatus Marinimicrobia bacterium]|nr:hypothetical protein [Candidatus Neomarinimicrobiota bacterium]HJM84123.1 hypothetical protein [Candidatus Neomarinimicrobiota bacterium]
MKKRYPMMISIVILISSVIAGTITGQINYQGKLPKKKSIKMEADPICGSYHEDDIFRESFIVDENNNLGNVMVWLERVNYDNSIPKDTIVLDQVGCMYKPHVMGIMKGQALLIKNSDPTLHNIHSYSNNNHSFNFAMPKVVKEKIISFDQPEDPFYIKCDVHPWMKSWIAVFDHPFFAVTDKHGNYSIENVPKGEYTVLAFQEKFKMAGILKNQISISESGSIESDFTFIRKQKKK